jgi:leucyl-tRNA synthetase
MVDKKVSENRDIDFAAIEKKWQKEWEKKGVFEVKSGSKKKKFYVLEMFPYPSASGLHMGHALNYTIGDVFARFKRMQGFNVLYPMGFDALGLPAENAAIKAGEHPKKFTGNAIKNYIRQMKELGLSYDWSKMVSTMEPEYYKWNQYFFLKFLEKGLVYRKKAPVNWCPDCNSVLANEQVHSGMCWRHHETEVEIKQLEQWFIKTTNYADELLEMVDDLDWPQRVKAMQKNWIGKSHGTKIDFEINREKWPVFTTRPDTMHGITFMVISAQHQRLMELVTPEQKKEVEKFLKKIKSVSEKEMEALEKEGAFTGSYAINPANGEKVPVHTGNFVVADYGSGMVMAVPAHDQRDFEFAKKYDIPIKVVIQPEVDELNAKKMSRAYTGDGRLVESGEFNGWNNREAISEITKSLSKKKKGGKMTQYKLRDWLISRQRYWGTPIPIIYCEDCGAVPVSEKDLPVELPEKVKFGEGNPLTTNKDFVNVKCPKCGKDARRETDTMDTFFDSSWYYLRYLDSENSKKAFDSKKVDYWMPVNQYIGGVEHACMHLIYARFFTKALRDLGMLNFDEPFTSLFNQGMLHGPDGDKMSKSKGNVINPDEVSEKYGMDTARFFLLSLAAPDKPRDWSDKGIQGSLRFIKKVVNYFDEVKITKADAKTESKLNKAIKGITKDIEDFKYNLAVIKIRDLFDILPTETSKQVLEKALKLISVFCPHIAEELWHKLGNKDFISLSEWPKVDEKKIDEKLEQAEESVDKAVGDIMNVIKIVKEKNGKDCEKVYVYVIPPELKNYDSELLSKRVGKEVKVFAINDKEIYDPDGKAKKAKFGKPGIYIE